ncbi:hypothetical protein NPIL_566381 [Nephila pilipes]|uniref:Uncharacterized protein n=1 Tax=Nephila pilipes TaxID=299642 RepID=A0A8X6IGI6_NEPPI|nr:hypothetical protein NPIL_566381 [Nephila pilipes]
MKKKNNCAFSSVTYLALCCFGPNFCVLTPLRTIVLARDGRAWNLHGSMFSHQMARTFRDEVPPHFVWPDQDYEIRSPMALGFLLGCSVSSQSTYR